MSESPINPITRHQIYLQRLGSQFANEFEPYIKRLDKAVREILTRGDISSKRELDQVLRELKQAAGDEYGAYVEQLEKELEGLADYESNWNADLLKQITAGIAITAAGAAAWRLANTRPIQTNDDGQSSLLAALLAGFVDSNVDRLLGVVRNSYYQGDTQAQMIQKIRGTRKNKFRDGLFSTTSRYAGVIARTASNHVSTTAKMATYNKNKDVLEGWEFVATLDHRTSNICRFNDSKVFDIGEGPLPPLHFGCRSTAVPVVKEQYSLLKFAEKGTRASSGASGGKQTKDQGYYDWLSTQPKWFQQDVLGKSKTELFRNGGLTTEEFRKLTSNNFGDPLTLPEIEQKDRQAWEMAGLAV